MQKNPLTFNNSYIDLGQDFYTEAQLSPVANPGLIKANFDLADELGFSMADLMAKNGLAIFAGNVQPAGAKPLAMVYAGHQFGGFNPQLGDGRAILLGDVVDPEGISFGLQLKGSGRTAYSRSGDGRAALGSVLREYLLSEAMAKLGVPTTRALAAVTTGETVAREQLLPGAILTRVASSFVRVGTFQYFAAQGNTAAVKKLADFVIEHHFQSVRDADNPYLALLNAIIEKQAALIAQWMNLGFIHGVMNTDNVSVVGETIDYGPCAFMDGFDFNQVYSFIDRDGRYAYGNQPSIGLWNLTRLAEALLPLFSDDGVLNNQQAVVEMAQAALASYNECYQRYWLSGMQKKLGLFLTQKDGAYENKDKKLIDDLLSLMAESKADFTLAFYCLSRLNISSTEQDKTLTELFFKPEKINDWLAQWRLRLNQEKLNDAERQAAMQAVNPIYIPRNHQVEAAIRAAEDDGDFSVFHSLYDVLQNPYEWQEGQEEYCRPPQPNEIVKQTFCGT